MNFMQQMQGTLNDEFNRSVTENGAVGYRTSGKELLDLNFAVASLRKATSDQIVDRFYRAFYEDKLLAMKWLFFARDVRGGLGERRLFRTILVAMANNNPEYILPLIRMIPEYGRFDDLWCLLDTKVSKFVLLFVKEQLLEDAESMGRNEPMSLLAKWLPSINASSKETRRYAKKICNFLGVSEANYRKAVSTMRLYLDVVECKMSSKHWDEIRYDAVPSRANLLYNNAFLRNDEQRRRAFLASVQKGDAHIHADTLYPHDIVAKYYGSGGWSFKLKEYDETLETLWKSLPDTVNGCGNTIVVADGSGSMRCNVGSSRTVTALSVANALAIYFAERSSGQFKNQYITFSNRPQLVNLSTGKNLREKLQIAGRHTEVADTNVEAVFDLILNTAIRCHMTQEDLPENILIVSDMEFNSCACSNNGSLNAGLFWVIADRYNAAGYKLPRLVFWNVNSRTGTIPVRENDFGVALVSGFSVNIAKMVMSNQTDPYKCLVEALNAPRYALIESAIGEIVRG